MPNSSSDKPSESKRPRLERSNHDDADPEEQSDYYYDDATGYEIYDDEDDENETED